MLVPVFLLGRPTMREQENHRHLFVKLELMRPYDSRDKTPLQQRLEELRLFLLPLSYHCSIQYKHERLPQTFLEQQDI